LEIAISLLHGDQLVVRGEDGGEAQLLAERQFAARDRIPETIAVLGRRKHPFAVRRKRDVIQLLAVVESQRSQAGDGPFGQRIAVAIGAGRLLVALRLRLLSFGGAGVSGRAEHQHQQQGDFRLRRQRAKRRKHRRRCGHDGGPRNHEGRCLFPSWYCGGAADPHTFSAIRSRAWKCAAS
jgi:hypothetical protein